MSRNDLPEGLKDISISETKKVLAAGRYDWTAVIAAIVGAAPTAFDYMAQFLAWLLSSPDAPQVAPELRTTLHTLAFILALFARGLLARKHSEPPGE